jgi:hypothetical protein
MEQGLLVIEHRAEIRMSVLLRQALMQRFLCRTFGWRAVSCGWTELEQISALRLSAVGSPPVRGDSLDVASVPPDLRPFPFLLLF